MIATNRKNIGIVDALCQSPDINVDLEQKVQIVYLQRVHFEQSLCRSFLQGSGLTALFIAAKNGHVEIFRKLLQHGASDKIYIDEHAVDIHGQFKKERKGIIKALEEHKLMVCAWWYSLWYT